MKKAKFRGKFVTRFRDMFICADSCRICTWFINNHCCNYDITLYGLYTRHIVLNKGELK